VQRSKCRTCRLRRQLPHHTIAFLAQPLSNSQVVGMPIELPVKDLALPRLDIVACCRRRKWDAYRNFERWSEFLASLASESFAVGIVGENGSSSDCDIASFRTWQDQPHAEALLHALSTARLHVGTDTGPTHLAALVSPALLVFRTERCPHENYLKALVIPVATRRSVPIRYVDDGWDNPKHVTEAARRFLSHGTR